MTIHICNKHIDKVAADGDRRLYIGRGSPLGNPYPISIDVSRDEAIRRYETWLALKIYHSDPEVCAMLSDIADKAMTGDVWLICYCAPQPCHGEVIRRYVERAIKEAKGRVKTHAKAR